MLEEDAGSVNSKVDVTETPNDEESSKFLTPDVNATDPVLDTSLKTLDEPEQCSVEESLSKASINIAEVTESNSVEKEPNSSKEEVQPLFPEVPKIQEVIVTVPEVTKTPEVSKIPEVIPKVGSVGSLEVIKAAEVAQAPEVTKAPEVRKALEVVKTPEVIKLLGLAKITEVAKAKAVVRVPEVVKVIEAAKVSEVTKVPEVSRVPDVVKIQEVVKSIEISKQTAPKIQEQMPLALEVPKVEPLVTKVEKKEKPEAKVVSGDVEMMEVAPVAEKKSVPAAVAVDKPKFDERMEQREKIMPLNGDGMEWGDGLGSATRRPRSYFDVAKVFTNFVFFNTLQIRSLFTCFQIITGVKVFGGPARVGTFSRIGNFVLLNALCITL